LHERSRIKNDDDTSTSRRGDENSFASRRAHAEDRPRTSPPRKKHKVVIHTSPYLRCVESAIGMSAGFSQSSGHYARLESREHRPPVQRSPHIYSNPSRSKTLDSNSLDSRYRAQRAAARATLQNPESSKPTLRVDAFLGEWNHPDYYKDIQAPPESTEMVSVAMEKLGTIPAPLVGTITPQRDYGSTTPTSTESHSPPKPSPLRMASLSWTLPDYGNSTLSPQSSTRSTPTRPALRPRASTKFYEPPTPNYALSNTETIPQGYVAHARDACVNVDYYWNSMLPPQEWGDGGNFGETWGQLHRRFRAGFLGMINWYIEHGTAASTHPDATSEEAEDDDTDIVLVIMTHSAGCNALMHAITNQPVLVDFQTASLTLVTHRDPTSLSLSLSTSTSRRHDPAESVFDDYELKVTGSVDHLRISLDALRSSPHLMAGLPEGNRRASLAALQTSSYSGGTNSPDPSGDRPHSRNAALGSMRRQRATSTAQRDRALSIEQSLAAAAASSQGLWTDRRRSSAAVQDGITNSPVMMSSAFPESIEDEEEDGDEVDLLSPLASEAVTTPFGGSSRGGLWGAGGGGAGAQRRDSSGSRRRAASEL